MGNNRTIPLLLACLVCLTGAATSVPAADYTGWRVDSVRIEGLPEGVSPPPTGGFALGMRTGLFATRKPAFSERALAQDVVRLRLALARRGLPQAVIEPEIVPNAAGGRLRVVFHVKPGRLVRYGDVTAEGVPPETPHLEAALRLLLPAGGPFRDGAVQNAVTALTSGLKEVGYAAPRIRPTVVRRDSFTADLRFLIEPGTRYVLSGAEVEGAPDDLVPLARRVMDVPTGRLYSPAVVTRARDGLRELGLFRQVRVDTRGSGGDSLAVTAHLQAAAPRSLRVSAGSWTDELWRVRARWRHLRLLSGGRGGELAAAVSRHLQEASATFWWPAMVAPRSRTEASVGWTRQDEDSYRLDEVKTGLALTLHPEPRTTLRAAADFADVNVVARGVDQSAFQDTGGRQFVLTFEGHRDRSDDLLDPTRGRRLSLNVAWSPPGALSNAPFVSGEATVTGYVPAARGLVAAGRFALGVARPLGGATELLPNRRFFAGGATTMRGYHRRALGPVDAEGDPVGGDMRLLASVELRAHVRGILSVAGFVDAGQVWARSADAKLSELQAAVGPALLVATLLGPVRLDVGHLVTAPRAGVGRNVVHVAIGHPF